MNRNELIKECNMYFLDKCNWVYDEEVYISVMKDIEKATVIVKGVACVGFYDNDDISVRDYASKIMHKKMISLGYL
tara:strand:- start:50 stop:277 length:228 start_codon:yes stop_codon:yes gene_type:complete